jgi:hypothetical protein
LPGVCLHIQPTLGGTHTLFLPSLSPQTQLHRRNSACLFINLDDLSSVQVDSLAPKVEMVFARPCSNLIESFRFLLAKTLCNVFIINLPLFRRPFS